MNVFKIPLIGGVLTAVIIVLSMYSPSSSLFMLLVALPVSVISLKWGIVKALQSLLAGMLLVLPFFGLKGAPLIILIGAVMLMLYIPIKLKQNIFNYIAAFATAIFVFLLIGFYFAEFLPSSENMSLASVFSKRIEEIREAYIQIGVPENKVNIVLQDLNQLMKRITLMLPAVYGTSLFIFLIINMFFTKIITNKLDKAKLALPFFREWDIHWLFSWGYVIGIAFQLFGNRLSQSLKILGLNALIFFGVVFTIQGLSVSAYYLNKWKVSRTGKIIGILSLVLLPPIIQILSWLGLFDVWFNYRKLERKS